MFSCSLSDVQDFTIHRTKPCSGADIKEPLRFSKVVVVVHYYYYYRTKPCSGADIKKPFRLSKVIVVVVIIDILVIVIMIIVILIIGRNLALERISRSLFASAK